MKTLAPRFSIPVIAIALLLPATAAAATDSDSDSAQAPLHWIPRARVSYHAPLGHAHSHWQPYTCLGFYLSCPTYIPGLTLTAGGQGGILQWRTSPDRKHLLFELSTVCSFALGPSERPWRLSPFAGVASVMVYHSNELVIDSHAFSPSESEFAATAGLEPSLRLGRMRLAVPLSASCVFSAPHPFVTIAAAVDIGGFL